MIQSQNLVDKICCRINQGGMSALKTCQTDNALALLASNPVVQVATFSALPSFTQYLGRMIYVQNENTYYYATGLNWIKDFTSTVSLFAFTITGSGNNAGSLGDGTTISRLSPVSILSNCYNWIQVSNGTSGGFPMASLGLRTDGTAWAWGCNNTGVLGDGTTVDRSSPVSVVGGFTDWCQVSLGNLHSLGLRTNGTAWAWGYNNFGQLGDGTTVSKSSPVSVVGGFTDWCQVSAGGSSVGLRTNGTAWAWGCNNFGQLGDGTTVSKSSPVSVIGGFTNWCQVSAGGCHNLGVRTNGTAWAWGNNTCGRLGDGTTVANSSPVSVIGGFTDWCQVSAGVSHSLGLRTNGTAWAWGTNASGQLGAGTAVTKSSPVSVVGGFTDWCQVSAGYETSGGLRTNGTLWTWGCNPDGRLGDNTIISKSSPVSVVGGGSWAQVDVGKSVMAVRSINKGF